MAKILDKRDHVADQKPREKYNVSTLISIVIIVFFYAFMFLSPNFMSGIGDFLYDFSPKTMHGRNLWIDSWVYCPDTHTMEVVVALQDNALNPNLTVQTAFRRMGKVQSGSAEIVISAPDIVVIQIPSVPSYDEVSLTLLDTNSTDSVKWYNNSSAMAEVASIETRTLTEYRVAQKEHEIESNKQIIAANQDTIIANETKIKELQQQILAFENTKKYQTAEQISNTNRDISQLETDISQLRTDNIRAETEIGEYEARNLNLQRQIADLKNNTAEP